MLNNVINNIKEKIKNYKVLILWILLLLACFVSLSFIFKFSSGSLTKPIRYDGGDNIMQYSNAKTIIENGWIWYADSLGAPFIACNLDYPPTVMDLFNLALMRFFAIFSDNPFLVVNLVYISSFFFICTTSYFVMIHLKVNEIISGLFSLTFAFLPFIFLRNVSHLVLSTYEFIPFAVLLCIWISREEVFIKGNTKKNIFTAVICILIGMNGIAYYPFFACVLMMVAGLGTSLGQKRINAFLQAVKCCALVCCSLLFCLMPHILHIMKNGSTGSGSRSKVEAEYYGMKIVQLFIPNNPGIGPIKSIQQAYSTAPLRNEGSEYLGIIGVIGFFILLVSLFVSDKNEENDAFSTISILKRLNIAAVLVGTIGGLGSLFSLVVSSSLRGYNRISTYIGFMCILAVGITCSCILSKLKAVGGRIALISVVVVVSILGIAEQIPKSTINADYQAIYTEMESDKVFTAQIEEKIPNGMIYQLPFHRYPEAGPVNGMSDYDEFKPYLYSKTLKWSYGSPKNRISSTWNESVSKLPVKDMLQVLCDAGFSGIYVNREAYSYEEWTALENEIISVSNGELIVSPLQNLSFISIEEYKNVISDDGIDTVDAEIFNKDPLYIVSGSTGAEGDENKWIWLDETSVLSVRNYSDSTIVNYSYSFTINCDYEGEYWVKIKTSAGEKTYTINKSVRIEEVMDLKPGNNLIEISTNAPKVIAPTDPRNLYIRMTDFDFSYEN